MVLLFQRTARCHERPLRLIDLRNTVRQFKDQRGREGMSCLTTGDDNSSRYDLPNHAGQQAAAARPDLWLSTSGSCEPQQGGR